MKTISARTTDETARKVEEVSREEAREVEQVAATALELYVALPASARQALRELVASEDPELLERAFMETTWALLKARWDQLSERIAEEIRERGELPAGDLDEEEIGQLAVEIVKQSRQPR